MRTYFHLDYLFNEGYDVDWEAQLAKDQDVVEW